MTEEVFRISGGTMFPGAPAACLKWLDLNEPQTLDRAATAGYCKDVIFGRLTGERATDPSDASMPFGDGTGIGYSDRVLELTGLAHRRSLLAPIVAPVPVARAARRGRVPARAARGHARHLGAVRLPGLRLRRRGWRGRAPRATR